MKLLIPPLELHTLQLIFDKLKPRFFLPMIVKFVLHCAPAFQRPLHQLPQPLLR